jgi:hypothetical protein
MLKDARLMLQQESYRSAADRAYYAMFHAVRAVLFKDGVEIPKTHAGLRNLFGQHFLVTGKLPKDLGRWLGEAFRLRQQGDYEVHTDLSKEPVERVVNAAEKFVQTLAEHVGGKPEGIVEN